MDQPLVIAIVIAIRTALVLLFLLLALRISGKRQLAQMNVYDLAMLMALANAVQNAMTKGRGEITSGMASAGALLFMGWLLSKVFVNLPSFRTKIVGVPMLLATDGAYVSANMKREQVTVEDMKAVMRKHGLSSISEVQMAMLEVDGTISLVPKEKRAEK